MKKLTLAQLEHHLFAAAVSEGDAFRMDITQYDREELDDYRHNLFYK